MFEASHSFFFVSCSLGVLLILGVIRTVPSFSLWTPLYARHSVFGIRFFALGLDELSTLRVPRRIHARHWDWELLDWFLLSLVGLIPHIICFPSTAGPVANFERKKALTVFIIIILVVILEYFRLKLDDRRTIWSPSI